jgi:hypothetical protein
VTYFNWLCSSSTPLPSINEDKHSIIVSLNIHHLIHTSLNHEHDLNQRLEQWQEDHKICDEIEELKPQRSPCLPLMHIPFLVAHLHDISNVSYLLPHGPQPLSLLTPPLHTPHWDEWNLLSSGGVLTQYLFYSILLRSLLTPDLLSLWEDILHLPEDHLEPLSPRPPSAPFSPKLQRIACPLDCIGMPYLLFVESLISEGGEIGPIPIAVYREVLTGEGTNEDNLSGQIRPAECLCRNLPYVFLGPPDDLVLQRSDFIFLLSSL